MQSTRIHLLAGIFAAILCLCFLAPDARAEDTKTCPQMSLCLGPLTIQPATAVAYQINLKTGDHLQGAILAGVSVMTDHFSIPLGGAALCGSGISPDLPGSKTAFQCDLFLSVTNWGAIGIGAQVYEGPQTGKTIFQGLLSFAATINSGGTASAFRSLKREVMAARTKAVE